MGCDAPADACETDDQADGGLPTLPDSVRQHLGGLLAAAYTQANDYTAIPDRFADLLDRLDAAFREAREGDDAAFRTDLLAVAPALRRFALSLSHDATAADDLVQDTLLKAWRNRTSFMPGTNFEAWTFTILRNQFLTDRRKHGREVQDEDGAHAARLATVPDQGDHLDLADVRGALAKLSPQMREALMLVTMQDLSYEEAAAIMRCQIGTVKSRVWRAREQLVKALGYTGADVGQDALTLSAMEGQRPT